MRAEVSRVLCSNCNCPHSTSICPACSFSFCSSLSSLRALCCEVATLNAHTTTATSSTPFNKPLSRNNAALRHAHHRTARARIRPQLCLTGACRFADQLQFPRRHFAGAYRHTARQLVSLRHIAHKLLHDTVFQRMKTDRHQTPHGFEMHHTLWQDPRKLFELVVEINPYSLKGARRRVLPSLACAHRFTNQLDELPRGMDGFDCG